MSRRHRAEKREIHPDPKFGDMDLTKFMNYIMLDGKKSVAERIVYDQSTGTLSIEGPIRVTENGTEVIITADQAELDQGLQNGLMMGARMVLDQQLQLASVQAHRVNGRYTQLSKVAVTSCQVCGANSTPLWQIRASRVVHDQEARQLYLGRV